MDYNNTKNYIVTTAFCFQKTVVHIQTLNFDTAAETLAHIEVDKTRAEQWKAEGSALYSMQIHFVKIYPNSLRVSVFHMTEEVLRERVDAEKGEVS
jgi:hypothetical protein